MQRRVDGKLHLHRTGDQRTAGRLQLAAELPAQPIDRELIGGGHPQRPVDQTQLDTVAEPEVESFSADFTSHRFPQG